MLPNNSMRKYLIESNFQTEEILPSVLATIIALYGGLHRFVSFSDQQCLSENVIFSPLHIHRISTLTTLLIDCLNGKQCHFVNLLDERAREDVSNDTIDLFVVWMCIEGVGQPWIYEKYLVWPAFWRALAKLRGVTLYLNEYYYAKTNIDCVNDQYTLSSSLFHEADQIIEQHVHSLSSCDRTVSTKLDLLSLTQAIVSAMCRLMLPGGERSLFRCGNVSKLDMLNLPVSNELQQLLMSEEDSLKTRFRRVADFVQFVSPPFLPKHLHADMDHLVERQQFHYETHPMMLYRHHSSFLLAILPRPFQPLFACLF